MRFKIDQISCFISKGHFLTFVFQLLGQGNYVVAMVRLRLMELLMPSTISSV